METPSSPDVSLEDVRSVFAQSDQWCTPLTAIEVADELECPRQAARYRLEELAERGVLQSKNVGDSDRIWWPATDGEPSASNMQDWSDTDQLGSFIDAVEEYAICMLDPDGHVVSWNEGAERIKGYSKDQILGEHFSTFYTDDDTDEGVPDRNLETATEDGRVEAEGWRVRQDGSTFWTDVVITAIRNDDGTVQGFTKITRDLTEQREYELRLRRERDLTEQILETVPVSVCLVSSDGELIRANGQMLDQLGIEEKNLDEYSVHEWELYDPEGDPLPIEEWPWARVLGSGEPVRDYQCQADLPGEGRRWLSFDAALLEGDRQEDERVVVSIADITEEKQRERQLVRERNQTEELLRTAPIAIAVQNAEGETILANQRAQDALGLSEQELIEEPEDAGDWEVLDTSGEPLAPDETPSSRVLATGEPVLDDELVIDPPSGERMYFHVNAAPIFDADGAIDRVITAGEDISELKRRERQLERRKTELETELSEVLDRISDAFYALDDEWRFSHLNDRAAEIMQQSEDELLGREIWEVFPDAADVYREQFEEAMDTQEPVTFEVYAEDVSAWLEFNAYPSETGLSIYFREVTERVERERELERALGLLDRTERIADVGGWEIDVETMDVFWTDYTFELLEVESDEEPPLDEALAMYHEDDHPIVEEAVEEALGSGDPFDVEARVHTDGGEVRWLRLQGVPETDGDEVVTLRGAAQDITEQVEREQELERYRTVVETVNDGIYTVDPDGEFTMVNEAYAEMTGYSRDELLGSDVSLVVDESVTESARDLERELVAGERETVMIEADVERADGGTVPAEATFALLPGDEEYERIGVVRDITERKAQERALEESERRYRTLVENFPDGVVALFDEDFRYTATGGQLIEELDIDPEEAIGASIWERYPEDLASEIEPYFHDALAGDPSTFEIERYGRHLMAHTLPIRNADDEVYAGMLVVQDITERIEYRRQLEETIEKLEESNERLEQFAYISSHDLQEPLRMVSSHLRRLEDQYREELEEEAREHIDYAVDGAERMGEMISDLLAYSRLDSEAKPLEPTDPEQVLDGVLDRLQLQIEENDAEVIVEEVPGVVADHNQLEQVFQNLVSNAIKYRGDDRPRIEIGAERSGGMVQFRVADNGIGIDPAYQDQIFEVFKRLHTHEDYPGTGIGLALCKKIVQRHGGDIWVESDSGEGSTFYFTIPHAGDNSG